MATKKTDQSSFPLFISFATCVSGLGDNEQSYIWEAMSPPEAAGL